MNPFYNIYQHKSFELIDPLIFLLVFDKLFFGDESKRIQINFEFLERSSYPETANLLLKYNESSKKAAN